MKKSLKTFLYRLKILTARKTNNYEASNKKFNKNISQWCKSDG